MEFMNWSAMKMFFAIMDLYWWIIPAVGIIVGMIFNYFRDK